MNKHAPQSETPTAVNGVNVTELMQTINRVKEDRQLAQFQFRVENRWQSGALNKSTIKDFTGTGEEHRTTGEGFEMSHSEPAVLQGDDSAPNPAESLLHALVGCMTTSLVFHAASRGIEVRSLDSKVAGDIDLQGFLGINDKVRNGYQSIRIHMNVDSDADADFLAKLAKLSPVYDVVSPSVPVELTVAHKV